MLRDLHSNIKVVRCISPVAVGTTGAANGKTGFPIDTQGYRGVEWIIDYGTDCSGSPIDMTRSM
jgi:hypothetical protein